VNPESDAASRDRQTYTILFVVCTAIVGAMFLPLFQSIVAGGDYRLHLGFARAMERRGELVSERPGFELLILALARVFPSGRNLAAAALWISVVAMMAKFGISAAMLKDDVGRARSLALALVLLFLAPITLDWRLHPLVSGVSNVHLGQMSGLIFHNPTTVVVFPLVLLLFTSSFRERHGLTAGLAAVQCLIKPSFVVAWIPAFALLQVWRHGLTWRKLAPTALAMVPALGVLAYQFAATERLGDGIVLAPLRAWREVSDNVLLSTIRSLAFPLAFCAFYFREMRERADHWFAWGILAVANLQYGLLYLDGADYPGNLTWSRYFAVYIVFLLCLGRFAPIASRAESWHGPGRITANALLAGLVALHLSSGLRYYLEGVSYGRW
jgi:hypothetical protein